MIDWPSDEDFRRGAVDPVINAEDGAFHVALVLNGTVSAGAYTAGVLDFLIQALDCLEQAKRNGQAANAPDVKIDLAAGASGGAVCAAILALALKLDFPPVTIENEAREGPRNPLYDTWVNRLSIEEFTEIDDLKTGPLYSLLNSRAIDRAAEALLRLANPGSARFLTPKVRDYVPDPFRVIATIFNLRGVPYRIDYGNITRSSRHVVAHGDWASFRIPKDLDTDQEAVPYEFTLSTNQQGLHYSSWEELTEYAKASGAFPAALQARSLHRPISHYQYRAVDVPADKSAKQAKFAGAKQLRPDFDALGITRSDIPYEFTAVDGGTTNNAPLELARTRLSGVEKRNPRDPDKATAAVLQIDPFVEAPLLTAPGRVDILSVLGQTVFGLVDHARFEAADILLAVDDKVSSRFLISPFDGTVSGPKALETAGLGAFRGFLDRDFRRHDFFLGRRNCWEYLTNELMLHPDNPVFGQHQNWTGDPNWRAVIPLYGSAAQQPPLPERPGSSLDMKKLEDRLGRRAARLIDLTTDGLNLPPTLSILTELLGDRALRNITLDFVMDQVRKAENER